MAEEIIISHHSPVVNILNEFFPFDSKRNLGADTLRLLPSHFILYFLFLYEKFLLSLSTSNTLNNLNNSAIPDLLFLKSNIEFANFFSSSENDFKDVEENVS